VAAAAAQDILEEFVELFTAKVAKLRGGVPWEAGVDLTPLPEPGKPALLAELRADAIAHGARCLTPGSGQDLGHTFVPPSILYPVTKDMRVWHEEQFGPLVPIGSFSDTSEVRPRHRPLLSFLASFPASFPARSATQLPVCLSTRSSA
jgi:glyceraldehyde-3-phosphate dehydrogenase (NADP+)